MGSSSPKHSHFRSVSERTLGVGRFRLLESKWMMAEINTGPVREFRFSFEYTGLLIQEAVPDRSDDRAERAPESGGGLPRLGVGYAAPAICLHWPRVAAWQGNLG